MSETDALNDLERLLIEAKSGRLPMQEFLLQFINAKIVVPSAGEVKDGWENFKPLVLRKDGIDYLACFSAPERIGANANDFPYYLQMRAAEFLKSLQTRLGLVVNPGSPVGFQVRPEGLAEIVKNITEIN